MTNNNYHEEEQHYSYDDERDECESYNRNHMSRSEYLERNASSFDENSRMTREEFRRSPRRGDRSNYSSQHDETKLHQSSASRRRDDIRVSHDSYHERDLNTSNRHVHGKRPEHDDNPAPKRASVMNAMWNMYDRFSRRSFFHHNDGFDADFSPKHYDAEACADERERGNHRRGKHDRMNDREILERRRYRSRSNERNGSGNGHDQSMEYHEDAPRDGRRHGDSVYNDKRGPLNSDETRYHSDKRHERRRGGGNEKIDQREMDIEVPLQIDIQSGRESIISDFGSARQIKSAPTVMQIGGRIPQGRRWTFRRGSHTQSRRKGRGDPNIRTPQKRWTFRRSHNHTGQNQNDVEKRQFRQDSPGQRSGHRLPQNRPGRSNQGATEREIIYKAILIPCIIFNAILLLLIFYVFFGGDTALRRFIQERINEVDTSD